MEKKVSASNLAEELAARCSMPQSASTDFVRAFFETIVDGLHEEGLVKIKGFGTFKVTQMDDRESVDVNNGERIIIKGYAKVSFAPDAALKEHINLPFAQFEATELADTYIADNIEENNDIAEEKVEEDAGPNVVQIEKKPETAETKPLNEVNTPDESVHLEVPEEVMQPDASKKDDLIVYINKKPHTLHWLYWIVALIFLLAGCVGGYLWGEKHKKSPSTYHPSEKDMVKVPDLTYLDLNASVGVDDTLQNRGVPYIVPLTENIKEKSLKDISMADTTDYIISGTLATHELQQDETIIRLSQKYYGDKRLWPYIVTHNCMKNPNEVHIGTMIAIPFLKNKTNP